MFRVKLRHKIGRKTSEGKHFLATGAIPTAILAVFIAALPPGANPAGL